MQEAWISDMLLNAGRRICAGAACRSAEVALVSRWIDLNRDVIIDYWNGMVDFDEVKPRLHQLQP